MGQTCSTITASCVEVCHNSGKAGAETEFNNKTINQKPIDSLSESARQSLLNMNRN